ncbi:hypothetical protein [Cohnella rhizosphaerae]|uniref:hypothetical protein n=1 Tax=Cohnella rhizosphaerae TaxID=1457232 RepID=UPI0030B8AEA6
MPLSPEVDAVQRLEEIVGADVDLQRVARLGRLEGAERHEHAHDRIRIAPNLQLHVVGMRRQPAFVRGLEAAVPCLIQKPFVANDLIAHADPQAFLTVDGDGRNARVAVGRLRQILAHLQMRQHLLAFRQLRVRCGLVPFVSQVAVEDERSEVVDLRLHHVDVRAVLVHFLQRGRFNVGADDRAGLVEDQHGECAERENEQQDEKSDQPVSERIEHRRPLHRGISLNIITQKKRASGIRPEGS